MHLSLTDDLSCVKLLNYGKKIITAYGNQVKISSVHFILKNFRSMKDEIVPSAEAIHKFNAGLSEFVSIVNKMPKDFLRVNKWRSDSILQHCY